MLTLGIDIGSTTTKAVILKNGTEIVASSVSAVAVGTRGVFDAVDLAFHDSGITPEDISCIVATGYGREMYRNADHRISELTCHAIGAYQLIPGIRTIVDIGGQDAKVIYLNDQGQMTGFVMNDKCAAGTGRFLDVMANILTLNVSQLADIAEKSGNPVRISNTCTVFAESEVISRLAGGAEIPDVVAGICESVASRVAMLAKRNPVVKDVCMTGGVAQNRAIRASLSHYLGVNIFWNEKSQLMGAIGAAIYGFRKMQE